MAAYGAFVQFLEELIEQQRRGCCCCRGEEERSEVGDLGSKAAASILLADRSRRIVVPSREEWIGMNLLERDDELPTRKKESRA